MKGIDFKMFYPNDLKKKFVFCKLRMSVDNFALYADRLNYNLPLDPLKLCIAAGRGQRWSEEELREREREARRNAELEAAYGDMPGGGGITGDPTSRRSEYRVNPIRIPFEPRASSIGPYDYIYCDFEADGTPVTRLSPTVSSPGGLPPVTLYDCLRRRCSLVIAVAHIAVLRVRRNAHRHSYSGSPSTTPTAPSVP